MQLETKTIHKIYDRLGDDISKEIFANRLMYSLSGDYRWINKAIRRAEGGREILDRLDECVAKGEMVIFGSGIWGKLLLQRISNYPWKCFVDNHPKTSEVHGIPVVEGKEFLKNYQEEIIFISSKVYHQEIYEQLICAGVPKENIINGGEILHKLSLAQYFDLDALKPDEGGEVFVDAGGFDGMTSVCFHQWSPQNSFSYLFEPDPDNIEKCRKNLEHHHVNCQIIPKGAWCEETTLNFCGNANNLSAINSSGEGTIAATMIDKELAGQKVTFIKMDIEGAEWEALTGAQNTIRIHKPKLAISVYHKLDDIWKIPDMILEYCPSYRLFLRHYSLIESETVLYAVI